ncbi:hypothetical protein EDD21DRAFT_422649 [Dissophora ornata]|nr:hypothetical protein EDD21DRAFT_422649 [Dissophora ornata]
MSSDGKTSYYAFASYRDLPTFLTAYNNIAAKDRCFNETIRDGRECVEYYDIDWADSQSEDIAELEQRVFAEFLEARNQFAPEYPVTEDMCRVLTSSSGYKVSLHIIIPQYVFENNSKHMKAFMDKFHLKRGGKDDTKLTKYIDTDVYTRNRGIRILGSCKRSSPGRILQKAEWHESSKKASDAEFYITNVSEESTRIAHVEPVTQVKRSKSSHKEDTTVQVGDDSKLPQSSVDAARYEAIVDMTAVSIKSRPKEKFNADSVYCRRFVELIDPIVRRLKTALGFKRSSYELLFSLMIKSAIGTGKTELCTDIIRQYPDHKMVFVTLRRTLAVATVERFKRFGFEHYRDIKGQIASKRVVVQAESLYRLYGPFYKEKVILILDELSPLFAQMTSTETMKERHDLSNQVLRAFIQGVERVICLDADMSNDDVNYVKTLRDDDVHVIHNTFQPQKGDQVVMYQSSDVLNDEIVNSMQGGKCIWISCTFSAHKTITIHEQFRKLGFKGMCITVDSSDSEKSDMAKNINTLMTGLDYFIHTPVVSQGIDYNVPDCVDLVAGFFCSRSEVNAESCRQMMRCVRSVKDKKYIVYIDQRTEDLPVTADDIRHWMDSQYSTITGPTSKLSGVKLNYIYGDHIKIDHDDYYNRLFTIVQVRKNLSLNGLFSRFITQMVDEGCVISAFIELCEKPELEKDEKLAKHKHALIRTYEIQDPEVVTPEWVDLYDNDNEKCVFENLIALATDPDTTMEDRLEEVQQREQLGLQFDLNTQTPHRLRDSNFVKLQCAVDILTACGFQSTFATNTVPTDVLKERITHLFESIPVLGVKIHGQDKYCQKKEKGDLPMVRALGN